MNERIKELSIQAVGKRSCYMIEAEYIKFAELIIRECLDIIDEEGSHEGGSIRSMNMIKQHFGVEE